MHDIGRFNVLVGNNDSGKSTLLDALETFLTRFDAGGGAQLDDHVWPRGSREGTMQFRAQIELDEYDLAEARKQTVQFFSRPDLAVPFKVDLVKTLRMDDTWMMPGIYASVKPGDGLKIGEGPQPTDGPAVNIVSFIARLLRGSKRIDVVRGAAPIQPRGGLRETLIPSTTLNTIKDWYNSRRSSDRTKLQSLNTLFRRLTDKEWNLVQVADHLIVRDGDYEAEARVLGGGTQETIHLAFQLVEAPHFLMIEEPEAHSHPGQTKVVFDVLKDLSKMHQVFVATHSTVFLEHAQFSEVYHVYKENGFTVCSKMSDKQFGSLAADLGLRPIHLYMTEGIVFVEGPCDAVTLRSWGDLLGVSLRPPAVGIVEMAGIDRSRYLIEVWKQILDLIRVPMFWLFDSNPARKDSIDRLTEYLKTRGVKETALKTLPRGDIEDYYPETILLDHLADRWGLTEEKKAALSERMRNTRRADAITDFLISQGNPQPRGDEWKLPAARHIAKTAKLTDYVGPVRGEIEALVGGVKETLKTSRN